MLGLGSIVGTGVFVSIALGAGVAGPAVVLAIALAAGLALCNGLSSAQLAAAQPVAGGTYEYGYERLHPALGFTAGWMFLAAKSASAATAALGCVGYLAQLMTGDNQWLGGLVGPNTAALVVLAVVAVVLLGIRRTSAVNITIISITLLALGAFVLVGAPLLWRNGSTHFTPFIAPASNGEPAAPAALLQATALMFVAYTGYGRIATLGEEVHHPRRTIPLAIIVTLAISAVLYMSVATVAIAAVGAEDFAAATRGGAAPLEVVAQRFGDMGVMGTATPLAVLVAIGAITAMLGVLLNLVLGLSRVALAMARRGDLPARIAHVSAHGNPVPAVLVAGALIIVLLMLGSVKAAWSFSAFTVLIYYGITNAAALRLPAEARIYPRAFAWMGLAGCLFLAFWVEPIYWAAGLGVIAVGLIWHVVAQRLHRRSA
ncbi:MAG: APC family permease [Phycisphaeraceae bacterium]